MIQTVEGLSDRFREILVKYQHDQGLSQKEIAEKMDVAAPALNKLIKGTTKVSLPMMLKAVSNLGLVPNDIFQVNN